MADRGASSDEGGRPSASCAGADDDEELQALGELLAATTARAVSWLPSDGIDVSLSSIRLLSRLHDDGPCRVTELARLEGVAQPSVSTQVQRLERHGLVLRSNAPVDGRVSLISLSDLGRERLVTVRRRYGANLRSRLAQLTEEQRRTLEEGLVLVQQLVGDAPESHGERLRARGSTSTIGKHIAVALQPRAAATETAGPLEVLVDNAGVCPPGSTVELDEAAVDTIRAVDVSGPRGRQQLGPDRLGDARGGRDRELRQATSSVCSAT